MAINKPTRRPHATNQYLIRGARAIKRVKERAPDTAYWNRPETDCDPWIVY